MTKFKRIAAGVIAVAAMAVTSVSASADSWKIDYTYGAPSSVSNQFVRREFVGLSSTVSVYVSCKVKTGSVALETKGFNADYNTITYASNEYYDFLRNPNPLGCTVEFWARESRVVADGIISA